MTADNTVTLPSGVVLAVRGVPQMLITEINREHEKKRPRPPVVLNAKKGREEENPDDPDYQEQLNAWETEGVLAQYDAFLLAGTTVVRVPDNLPTDDDPSWIDTMEALGQDVSTPERRRLRWLHYVAAPSPSGIALLAKEVGTRTFVSEDEVAAAADGFPGDGRGEADRGAK